MRFSLVGYLWFAVLFGLQAPRPSPAPERIPKPQVELRLTVDRPVVVSPWLDGGTGCRLTIRNLGPIPLRLLEPQDGSESGWRNPSISWDRADGTPVRPPYRCGNVNGIDESDYFVLAPGATREIAVRMPLESGENRLRAVYDISADRSDVDYVGRPFPSESYSSPSSENPGVRLYRALTPIHAASNFVSVTIGSGSSASDSGSLARR